MEPTNRRTILVHKEGEEGSIEIDYDTGIVQTPIDQRPDWADGLANALIQERVTFYEARLGPAFGDEHKRPQAIVYQDLAWLGAGDDGEMTELAADEDYRMNVVAQVLGIEREPAQSEADFGKVLAEAEIDMQNRYIPSDVELIDNEMATTFGGAPRKTEADKATGTG